MIYCTLTEAFGNEYDDNVITEQKKVEPVVHYTCYDFREHLRNCSHCSNILAETRNQFYNQDDNSNIIILFLILLLIWTMTSKN